MNSIWPWLALILLGAYHGINPAMGWLFAVAMGLQERSARAVLRSLAPIALGHEAAVALSVAVVTMLALVTEPQTLRILGALALIAFGLFKLARPRSHPKWVGFRISMPELALWSFLMSSAHGAGLMLFPVLSRMTVIDPGQAAHGSLLANHGATVAAVVQGGAVVMVHTLAMLAVMGAVALTVYLKLGVTMLRRAWVNLDLVWAVTLLVAGGVTFVM